MITGMWICLVMEDVYNNSTEDAYGSIGCPGRGTPILGHTKDVWPEWVSFPGQKPADVCKFLPKNLRMCHNFNT